MRIILAFCIALFSGCLFAQNDVWSGEVASIYFPIKLNGKWQFRVSNDSTQTIGKQYDTIHFCVSKYYPTHFLAVNGINYEFFDHELKLIDAGKFVDFKMSQNDLFIHWNKAWKRYHFETEKLSNFQADSILIRKELTYLFFNAKMGVITEEAFIEPNYFRIAPFEEFNIESTRKYLLTLNKGKFGLIDYKGRTIVPEVASIIQEENFDVIKYKEDHWKYVFPDGKVVDPLGCEIHLYSDYRYKIYNKERTKGVLYVAHKAVAKTNRYDDVFINDEMHNYFVRKQDKIGMLDQNFNEVIAPFCEQVEFLGKTGDEINDANSLKSFYKFLQKDKWGVVNSSGKILIQPTYDNILEIVQIGNLKGYKVARNGFVGVIDENEKVVIPFVYSNVEQFGAGFITEKGERIGFIRNDGKQIFDNVYASFLIDRVSSLTVTDEITVFRKDNLYVFLNRFAEQLVEKPCKDYQFSYNVLKCYFDDGIVVYYLENGRVVETSSYPGIHSASIESPYAKHFHHCADFDEDYLELNQLTGKYTSRHMLKSGLALKPNYSYVEPSIFGTYFHGAKIIDTSITFQHKEFPELTAYNIYNWLACSAGNYPDQQILSTGVFKSLRMSSYSSSDVFVVNQNEKMHWLTNDSGETLKQEIDAKGITFVDKADNNYQFVCIGGDIERVDIDGSYMSYMDYFHFLNQGRNLWFSSTAEAANIMNPTHGVNFSNSSYFLRPVKFMSSAAGTFEIDSLLNSHYVSFLGYKKKGQKNWNLTVNLMDIKAYSVTDISNVQYWNDESKDFVILEKIIDNQPKKAIYSTTLMPFTDFEYDEIVYAGSIGFLVKINESYFYIDQMGMRLF